MCISLLLSLFGCGKGQVVDGPDMEYTQPWAEFTLSRSDSYAQYNFSFTVTETDQGALVDGTCRDEDGTEYETETGIALSAETLWALRRMNLEQLTNVTEEDSSEDDLLILDASILTLTIVLKDGTVEKKHISAERSLEIYQLLLPYFIQTLS